jgi:GNAT superfamily N-acetyltransferase
MDAMDAASVLSRLRERAVALEDEVRELQAKLEACRRSRPGAVQLPSPSQRVRLPWPRAQASPARRAATFSLDWEFSALHTQSMLHPQPEDGVRTLLAQAVAGTAEEALLGAEAAVVSVGLQIGEREADGSFMAVTDEPPTQSETVLRVTALGDSNSWLAILCLPGLSAFEETRLVTALAEGGVSTTRATSLPHMRQETDPFDVPGLHVTRFSLAFATGGSLVDTGPTTLFTMSTSDGLVVAKALCAYENAERAVGGPTLLLLEVAREWSGRGLGSLLLQAVDEFCGMLLKPLGPRLPPLMASGVHKGAAVRWFVRRGFRDDDGAGEELSRPLSEPETS